MSAEIQDLTEEEWKDICSIIRRENGNNEVIFENNYIDMLDYLHEYVNKNHRWIIVPGSTRGKIKRKEYTNYVLKLESDGSIGLYSR